MISKIQLVTSNQVKKWLTQPDEVALIDVRELGEYSAGHPFFATPIPYSGFEYQITDLVPNPNCRMIMLDNNDGVALKAANACILLGYINVNILEGGIHSWQSTELELYEGVNTPSKAFGELIEEKYHTPTITALELTRRRENSENIVVIDGRPVSEFRKMSIPNAICCPNGELALRISSIAPDPGTTIVINCAGRTRSIIGAQTLIDLGIENPVFALENGTQGWFLSGQYLQHNKNRSYSDFSNHSDIASSQQKANNMALRHDVKTLSIDQLYDIAKNTNRTIYVFDVRTKEEYEKDGLSFAVHAPGGQLIQSTDTWVAVRGALMVIIDSENVRAPVVATWLKRLGHNSAIINCSFDKLIDLTEAFTKQIQPPPKSIETIKLHELDMRRKWNIIDIRPSMKYRKAHINGSTWGNRPRIDQLQINPNDNLLLISESVSKATLFELEARHMGHSGEIKNLDSGIEDLKHSAFTIVSTPDYPPDEDCIDFIFHTHDRHKGNADSAKAYLKWETQLVSQLHESERKTFQI